MGNISDSDTDVFGETGQRLVAGVDEAGRGCIAGPVVVAAVILDSNDPIEGLADSKVLSSAKRQQLYPQILERAMAVGIAIVGTATIERLNILYASLYGMRRAVERLSVQPKKVLVDGNKAPEIDNIYVETVVKGDTLHACISAASVVAKVVRDRQMCKYERRYPGYGFERHKGYATEAHYDQLLLLGACPIHRKGFRLSRQELLFEV